MQAGIRHAGLPAPDEATGSVLFSFLGLHHSNVPTGQAMTGCAGPAGSFQSFFEREAGELLQPAGPGSAATAQARATGKGCEKGDIGQCNIGLVRDRNPRASPSPWQPCGGKDDVGSPGRSAAHCGAPCPLTTKHFTPGPLLSSLTILLPPRFYTTGKARSLAAELMAEKVVFP